MTIRIANDHLFGIRFEALTGVWELDHGFHVSMLGQPVELIKTVTLDDVFGLIEETPMFKHFAEGYFNCSLADIRRSRPESVHDQDVVFPYIETFPGIYRLEANPSPIQRLEVSRNAMIHAETEEMKIGYCMHAISSRLASNVHCSSFNDVKRIPLRIDRTFVISDGMDICLEKQRAFTLLEFLEATVGNFVLNRPRWSPGEVDELDQKEFKIKRWARTELAASEMGTNNRVFGDDDDALGCLVAV